MNPMKKIFLPCALLVTMAAAPLHAEELTSVLTVSGNAILEVPADQLQVSIGVEAEATTVDDAHSKAVASMESVIKAMKRLGLQEKDEYTIERYDVSPQWSSRPRNNQDPNWRATIVGYTVRTNMHIKTGKLDLAGKIISSSVDAGANDIGSVIFDLADPRTSRSEAIEHATHNAMTDAQTMADAAGVKLVHIQSLSLDGSDYNPRPMKAAMEYGMMARAGDSMAPSAPMIAGDVAVRASVKLTWAISGP